MVVEGRVYRVRVGRDGVGLALRGVDVSQGLGIRVRTGEARET